MALSRGSLIIAAQEQRHDQRRHRRNEGDDGKKISHGSVPHRKRHPGEQGSNPQHHREGVCKDVAGLRPTRESGQERNDPHGHPVQRAVDDLAIALLPQEAAQPLRGAHEDHVVKLVKVPFVQQEQVKRALLCCQLCRQVRAADVELPRQRKAQQHGDERRHLDPFRRLMRVVDHMVVRPQIDRPFRGAMRLGRVAPSWPASVAAASLAAAAGSAAA